MAMFTACFDASGHPSGTTPTLFYSGFVSSGDDWVEFETAWLALLDDYKIKNPFHMTEFAAGKGQYRSWFLDKASRTEFYGKALGLIQRWTNRDFSQGIVLADFRRMHQEYDIPESADVEAVLRTPLSYCGVGAYVQLLAWELSVKKRGVHFHGPIEIIVDRGDKDRGEFWNTMRTVFNVDPVPRDKTKFIPLQAADILAWEHARVFADHRAGKAAPRDEFTQCARRFPGSGDWVFSQWGKLSAYCEEKGFPKHGQP